MNSKEAEKSFDEELDHIEEYLNMNKRKEFIGGKEITPLTFINRIHALEGIIFDLKEVLKFYAEKEIYEQKPIGYNLGSEIESDCGRRAIEILEKHNKSFNQIYEETDKQ